MTHKKSCQQHFDDNDDDDDDEEDDDDNYVVMMMILNATAQKIDDGEADVFRFNVDCRQYAITLPDDDHHYHPVFNIYWTKRASYSPTTE